MLLMVVSPLIDQLPLALVGRKITLELLKNQLVERVETRPTSRKQFNVTCAHLGRVHGSSMATATAAAMESAAATEATGGCGSESTF
jgi:hypothetical protein